MNLSDKDFAMMFSKTLKGTKQKELPDRFATVQDSTAAGTPYIFILNKRTGGNKVHYLSLHPHKGYILPHVQSVIWPKLKGWVDFSSVVYKNILYIMGGKDRETGKFTSKVFRFDPSDDRWTQLSSLKRPKAYFTANVMESRIVISGGEGNGNEILDSIESYDPLIDIWSVEGRMPEPRKHHTATVMNNRIYICGGQGQKAAFNNNLWELRRDYKTIGGKEVFFHQWYNEWGQVYDRKIQQTMLVPVTDKLFCIGGLVQGPTEDGIRLSDEQDIDEPASDGEEEEERQRKKQSEPYVPTYMKILAEETSTRQRKKRGPKNVTRSTRRMISIDVGNNAVRQKNPFNGVTTEKRLPQPRVGAALIQIGNRVYMIGGYRIEDEQMYVPQVQYYHIRKKKWYSTFELKTYDSEPFRDIDVHKIIIPCNNPNFHVLQAAYKYPMW